MEQNKPHDFPNDLYDFAYIHKFDEQIDVLANMVETEDWDYKNLQGTQNKPVLYNYVKSTYKRIAEEKKISVTSTEDYCCWNTGLITNSQEPVYAVFDRNKNKTSDATQYWHFLKFFRRGDRELTRFSSLPEMAHYFDEPSELVFDSRKELRVNIEHIIEDNLIRFPESIKNMNPFALQNIVKGAIDSAIERAKRNYKIAIPQYYQGAIQLLLPLNLLEPQKADLALVIERIDDFYHGSTCLTLDMAYNNARQLARPDRDWLVP